ncbi:uracil-DNA glycosylase family protein [Alicyclobacillus fructus]|uniref:uracil-DNA glycosylase family protein n=1 Tax=Alicyclobacillus fructus TaxID=2816082 RepID=UPI001A8D1488|nr:uracil-DNA glycosylase family protein [Alicyclobacillus fructus]
MEELSVRDLAFLIWQIKAPFRGEWILMTVEQFTAKVDKFIRKLEKLRFENTENMYAHDTYGPIRQENLRIYLNRMRDLRPKVLLVGEAPGYRGCALTGIPFTSEDIMLKGIENHNVLGYRHGYRKASDNQQPMKENTATVVWETLQELKELPLLWNAFPLHPHVDGNERSNRSPNAQELKAGFWFIESLIRLFDIEMVIAVGRKAQKALDRDIRLADLPHLKFQHIRHPSRGGTKEFEERLKQIFDERLSTISTV